MCFFTGLNECRGDQLTDISLPTDLQSEVLLPCFFESDFLNSNQTNESCVVWTHLNSTNREIVEIGLDGEAKFWNNRLERIKTFPKLPESELLDFSIQIRNVQQSDLGVYHCTLFRETGCLLFYKRIELHNGKWEYCWLKSQCASIAWNAALIKKFYFHCLARQITIRADVGLNTCACAQCLYFISQDLKIRCEKPCKTWWQYGKICTVAIKFIQRL